MRHKNEIRADLVEALDSEANERMAALGFQRRRSSDSYVRKARDATQTIVLKPIYPRRRDANTDPEVHIYPMVRIEMPRVGARAFDLVEADHWPPLSASGLILNEPAEFSSPSRPGGRYASGKTQITAAIAESISMIEKWAIPQIDMLQSPEDLIRFYEQRKKDDPEPDQGDWYIYVAAAYSLIDREGKARDVLTRHLAAPYLRRKQAAALASLDSWLR